jgi:hypothetical protein
MKKFASLLAAFSFLLGACSADTRLVLTVSVFNLIPEPLQTLIFPVATGIGFAIDIPGKDGFDESVFSTVPAIVFEDIEGFKVHLDGDFSLAGDGLDFTGDVPNAEIDFELFLSAADSPFVAPEDVIKQSMTFELNETKAESLVFNIDEASHPKLLALIQTGVFKIGLRVTFVKVEELGGLGLASLKISDLGMAVATKVGDLIR